MATEKLMIHKFVKWELEYFRANCNFTDEELEVFNSRARNESYTSIAYRLNMSERNVYRIAKQMKRKMMRVI